MSMDTMLKPSASQRKLDAALFKAVRCDDGVGVMNAISAGANPYAVSRGMNPLERAMKFFPKIWSPVSVGTLMVATGVVPDQGRGHMRSVFAEGLANHGQSGALTLMLGVASGKERDDILTLVRTLLASIPFDHEGISAVAEVVFPEAADAEECSSMSTAPWLHEVICCGDADVVGMCLVFPKDRNPWQWKFWSFPSNARVLSHILSLSPRLDARWLGMTPFHLSAFTGNEDAMEALLLAGADPYLPDGNDKIVGEGYGFVTEKQLALIDSHRLQKELPGATPKRRQRL